MPYIKAKDREQYNKEIDWLVRILECNPVGHLNYVFSQIIWKLFVRNQNGKSYAYGNSLMGVLLCIANEFYRRKLGPLEDEKIKQNGDLTP